MQQLWQKSAGFSRWHIALALLGLVFLVLFTLALWFASRPANVHNIVATGEAVRQQTLSYTLRNAQGRVVVMDVVSDQNIDMGYGSSKTASDALRNQLFLDVENNTSSMLFPTHGQLIARVHEITDRGVLSHYHHASAEEKATVRARLYEVVTKDSNGDERLSDRDYKTLMLARADGTQLLALAASAQNPVKALHGAELYGPNELRLLVLGADEITHLHRFDFGRWVAQPSAALPGLR